MLCAVPGYLSAPSLCTTCLKVWPSAWRLAAPTRRKPSRWRQASLSRTCPEGRVVTLALRSVGHGRLAAVGVGMVSGLIEPVAAIAGAAVVSVAVGLLPSGVAFAAGAILYAVSHEAIPGSHLQGNAGHATAGLLLDSVLMMLLDTALTPALPR